MRGLNIVIIAGNVGKEPNVKYSQSGTAVATFSIAISEKWKSRGGEDQEKTEWVPVVCFGNIAENCSKYVGKGAPVLVVGKFTTREYEDRGGEKKRIIEVVAQNVQFLGSKKKEGRDDYVPSGDEDDVPF